MEQDIEILEEIKDMFIHFKNYGWINDIKKDIDTDKAIQAIEHLIKAYKELEEENEEKQKTIETMRYIKAICRSQEDSYLLDKDMCTKQNKYMLEVENGAFVDANALYRIWKNSIPVSLVEEKIEEVNKEDENLMYKNNIIKILQELLEKRK